VTRDCLKETYNLIAQPMVMVQQQTQEEAMVEWLNGSFALIQKVTLFDFTEYYLLLGASIPDDVDFELLFIKAWKVMSIIHPLKFAYNFFISLAGMLIKLQVQHENFVTY
jgi:hypothetical protein